MSESSIELQRKASAEVKYKRGGSDSSSSSSSSSSSPEASKASHISSSGHHDPTTLAAGPDVIIHEELSTPAPAVRSRKPAGLHIDDEHFLHGPHITTDTEIGLRPLMRPPALHRFIGRHEPRLEDYRISERCCGYTSS